MMKPHQVCIIDLDIYKCINPDISSDEVIITEDRIDHCNLHDDAYDRNQDFMQQVLLEPDYILQDKKRENTGLVIKRMLNAEKRLIEVVLRIKVPQDPSEYKNSIISCWELSERRLENYLRSRKILYKAPEK